MSDTNFIQCRDKDIVSILKKTDVFLGNRMFDGKRILMKYRVEFAPFYFSHASQWRIRVFSRTINYKIGLNPADNLKEYIYINDNNIDQFYFPVDMVVEYNKKKQLTDLLNNNQPKQ